MMRSDLQYRSLMEKHGFEPNEQSVEMVTETQRDDMLGHIKKAIYHVNSQRGHRTSELEHRLDKAMVELLMINVQVAEVYSPPRVAAMARTMGLRAGWSLDLTTRDHDGKWWNFNDLEMRNRAIRKVI